jgi:hypothetical protein
MHVSTVLRMGPEILGALTCASAISAIFCAGTFSVVSQILSIAQRSVTSIAGAAAGLVILAWTNTLWGAVFAVAVLSYSVMLQVCGTNAQLQEDVANEARGGASALYSAAFWGVAPVGALVLGIQGQFLGIRNALSINAIACFSGIAAVRYWKRAIGRKRDPLSVNERACLSKSYAGENERSRASDGGARTYDCNLNSSTEELRA